MTGGVYDEDLRSRYPTRLVGYLYKPFTETKLLEFIARIVEGENGYTTV